MKNTKKKSTGGRNPLPKGEKKQEVRLFIKGSKIRALGGLKQVKNKLYQSLDAPNINVPITESQK